MNTLYIQTTAIPRSELHNEGVIKAVKFLDTCEHFDRIRWFINIDEVTSKDYEFESSDITQQNFMNAAVGFERTEMFININDEPCFYNAFRTLTMAVKDDVITQQLSNDNYCVMWLEDDWYFKKEDQYKKDMEVFLENDSYLVNTLYWYKINMGGNPDVIKGEVFELFDSLNWDEDNKRDPEHIRKEEVFKEDVWIDPWSSEQISFTDKLVRINTSKGRPNTLGHQMNYKVLATDNIEDVGDDWRDNLKIKKDWESDDKSGIPGSKSYTYK
tara:strand:+ start:1048 stop:1860 length:813 start_codon:yes stop_codon:yes gene_type:complete